MVNSKLIAKAVFVTRRWLAKKASKIDQGEVLKDICLDSSTSTSYFLTLTIANWIAMSRERVQPLKDFLISDCRVSPDHIQTEVTKRQQV